MKVEDDNPKYKWCFLVKIQENYACLTVSTITYKTVVIKTQNNIIRKLWAVKIKPSHVSFSILKVKPTNFFLLKPPILSHS